MGWMRAMCIPTYVGVPGLELTRLVVGSFDDVTVEPSRLPVWGGGAGVAGGGFIVVFRYCDGPW